MGSLISVFVRVQGLGETRDPVNSEIELIPERVCHMYVCVFVFRTPDILRQLLRYGCYINVDRLAEGGWQFRLI